ncbi:MAG: hypothetical protein ABI995_16485 [Acidobacteriota bacterium]
MSRCSRYCQGVDIHSPQFRRIFPKVVYIMIGIGLLLILISTMLVALGFGE